MEKYLELKKEIEDLGLFKRNYSYYFILSTFILTGFIFSLWFLTITDNLFLQILNALFLSFLGVQSGMLGHDLSHEQVFKNKFWNQFWAFWVWGIICGLSESKWFSTHNAHHKANKYINIYKENSKI